MINGVEIKKLVTHSDDRGFFRELIRVTDPFFAPSFGQISHSLVKQGVVKAWHAHTSQTQWTYVACGLLQVVLFDNRPDSSTYRSLLEFLTGDGQAPKVYVFPPGVLHGYKCLSGPAHVIYVTSGIYDLQDEVRIPLDAPGFGYDWGMTEKSQ